MLLTSRGDPNHQDAAGDTCLHLAARNDDEKLITLLMAHDKIQKNSQNLVRIISNRFNGTIVC